MSQLPDTAVCLHCGYSLRGLPENICPECGRGFDPADPASWWDRTWPRSARMWRRWLGPLPLWHKALTIISTVLLLDFLIWPYRRMDDVQVVQLIGAVAFLIGLFLSYLLRKRAAQLCLIYGWAPEAGEHVVCKSRTVLICGVLLSASVVLAPVVMSARVLLSMPFLEYKARQLNRAGLSDNRPQIVGLFLVKRVGRLADGGIKLQPGSNGEQALVYYSWTIPTPPDKWTGLTRWYWMGGRRW
jgi:hypothetical protein